MNIIEKAMPVGLDAAFESLTATEPLDYVQPSGFATPRLLRWKEAA